MTRTIMYNYFCFCTFTQSSMNMLLRREITQMWDMWSCIISFFASFNRKQAVVGQWTEACLHQAFNYGYFYHHFKMICIVLNTSNDIKKAVILLIYWFWYTYLFILYLYINTCCNSIYSIFPYYLFFNLGQLSRQTKSLFLDTQALMLTSWHFMHRF